MTDEPPQPPRPPLGRHPQAEEQVAPLPPVRLEKGGGGEAGGPSPQPVALRPVAPNVQVYPMAFTGEAGEYFRIWIVNTALSIVTLGLYLPWARVRQRQYFYGHTWLDGHNFEYTAEPLALLRGYLIVGAFFLTYTLSQNFEKTYWLAGLIAVLFFVLYPWLVMKSLRFTAANTAHRGLRFRHHGQAGEAYLAYGLGNIVGGLSSALGLPWAWFMQRRFQVHNAAYGNARATFRGDVGQFYLIGLTGLGLTIGGTVLLAVPLIAVFAVVGGLRSNLDDWSWTGIAVAVGAAYLAFLALYVVAWQYVRAATMRYVLNHVEIGGVVRTGASFSPWRLVWISLTNRLAQVFTLGLATPWADVRRARYVAQGVHVRAIAPLDDFAADVTLGESALGEAATELLDINLGF